MSVNRELWTSEFTETGHPGWPCPTCRTGSLHLRPDTLAKQETSDSHLDEERGDIDAYKARFACLFRCGNSDCHEVIAVSGMVRLVELSNYSTEERFIPQSFIPAPPMIRVPARCPTDIKEEIKASFALYWIDRSASLNRIRLAIELLLSSLKIPKTIVNKKNKRESLHLHSPIDKLRSKRPALGDLCDRLLAVKHLGNAGSHAGDVQPTDVFDGLDILEQVLNDLYTRSESELAKTVKAINKRKGPRKRK